MSALSDFVSSNKTKIAATVIGGIAMAAVAGSLPGMNGEALARGSHHSFHSYHHSGSSHAPNFYSLFESWKTSSTHHETSTSSGAAASTPHESVPAAATSSVSETKSSNSGWSFHRLMRVFSSDDTNDTISEAQTASDEAKAEKPADDTENLQEAISDKRARLENAIKELENLSDAVDKARDLDASERDETISAAVGVYNDAVSDTEFNSDKPKATEISAGDSDISFDVKKFNEQWKAARGSTDMLQKLRPMQGQ